MVEQHLTVTLAISQLWIVHGWTALDCCTCYESIMNCSWLNSTWLLHLLWVNYELFMVEQHLTVALVLSQLWILHGWTALDCCTCYESIMNSSWLNSTWLVFFRVSCSLAIRQIWIVHGWSGFNFYTCNKSIMNCLWLNRTWLVLLL